MNISSVLINAKEEMKEQILKDINSVKDCSVELVESEKIIVLIESASLDDELKAYKSLEKINGIISINMVFSYQELDDDIKQIQKEKAQELVNKKEDAKDIKYSGSIYNKF